VISSEDTNTHNKIVIVMFVILLALPYITNINMRITFRSISKIKNNFYPYFTLELLIYEE